MNERKPYNERLFGSGVRGYVHRARFRWLLKQLARHGYQHRALSLIELGCFDGKIVEYLATLPCTLTRYLGIDAGWVGGLDAARRRFGADPSKEFVQCQSVAQLPIVSEPFECGICMETFEHLPAADLSAYVEHFARSVRGILFVTVPIERGAMFALKRFAKAALGLPREPYRWAEVVAACMSNMSAIERHEHKGFDERVVIAELARHTQILEVEGIVPGSPLPSLNFQIGICARTRY